MLSTAKLSLNIRLKHAALYVFYNFSMKDFSSKKNDENTIQYSDLCLQLKWDFQSEVFVNCICATHVPFFDFHLVFNSKD